MKRDIGPCIIFVLALLTIGLVFPAVSQAQPPPAHGAMIVKTCTGPVRTCDSNLECDNENACIAGIPNKSENKSVEIK